MPSPRGPQPLSYRRLKRTELGALAALELDPDQTERFLGPITDILTAVRRGPAHSLYTIEADGVLAGFFVVHPELRDQSCWWLGWLALNRQQQGRGYGRAALTAAVERMRRVEGCRRVRLLVAPDNALARAMYRRAGFHDRGTWTATGELVMEFAFADTVDPGRLDAFNLAAVAARTRRVFRHRRLRRTAGPHAAWVIGVERGPPAIVAGPRRPQVRGDASSARYRQARSARSASRGG